MKLGLGFTYCETNYKKQMTHSPNRALGFKWDYHCLYKNLMPITQNNKTISLKLGPKLNYPDNEIGSRIQIW